MAANMPIRVRELMENDSAAKPSVENEKNTVNVHSYYSNVYIYYSNIK